MGSVTSGCGVFAALVTSLAFGEPMTLEGALERARSHAPAVRLAARLVTEAEASRVGQGIILPTNPRLFADYRPMVVELPGQPVDPRHGYNVGVDGLVEVSGAGSARVDEAERRVALATTELKLQQARAAAEAWEAYVETQLAQDRVEALRQALALQERVAQASKERVNVGVAGEPDVTTVSAELASVRAELLEAERRRDESRLELATLLDLPLGGEVVLAEAPLGLREVPEGTQLVQQALEKRPELQALKARLDLLEATDSRLFREAFPKVGWNLGLDAAPASPVFGYLGLSVELPVAQRNQGPRAVVAAQKTTEQTRLETELRRVEREVALARGNYASRKAQVQLLEEQGVPSARRTVELIEAGWRAGRFDVFRLTSATRDLVRIERERLESLLEAWGDYIELQRVSGGLNP